MGVAPLPALPAQAKSSEQTSIVFQPDWFPNAQFAGFFWAAESDLYAEHGLDVTFAHFDFGVDFIEAVSSGEAAFLESGMTDVPIDLDRFLLISSAANSL
jgi:ABC-type nitrate/sulfonate/bicarbonate transport system substrate-binding protein